MQVQQSSSVHAPSQLTEIHALSKFKMTQHTAQSTDLNAAIQSLMEEMMRPLFERLQAHKAAFAQYCRFKQFAVQPIGDRQIRYHRVLGQGAFGTVHGCIVAQTGTMLAMKIMSKKRIKVKHSKSQVSPSNQKHIL